MNSWKTQSKLKVFVRLNAAALLIVPGSAAIAGDGPWLTLTDETATRLIADPAIGVDDDQEKDYAWGDVDGDGDTDLICVRKQPFTSTGGRRNVLFMNEGILEGHAMNGVLVDRTELFIHDVDPTNADSDFLDATNDRDVVLVDVNGDGWLDIVTATTLSDTQPKTISHPRVYINLGEDAGNWLGFNYEESRIPELEPAQAPATPRFCSVAAGDLTGDGKPDLYFGDYDSPSTTQLFDFNNRLLINDGAGNFTDETAARLTNEMRNSAFGAASVIADMNGDGTPDIVKQTSLNAPLHVAITYNDDNSPGTFTSYNVEYTLAPYFVSVDDLNNDGMLDIVVTDDGQDRYMLNQGNQSGIAQFVSYTLPENGSDFGGNSFIADLDRDCYMDIIITDVDVDISGCSRLTNIYRNKRTPLDDLFANESGVIPAGQRVGVHDAAIFDLNGDNWPDIVLGRCDGMEIWIQTPGDNLTIDFPFGQPATGLTGEPTEILIELLPVCHEVVNLAASRLRYRVDGGAFEVAPLLDLNDNLFQATISALECGAQVEYYVEAELDTGEPFLDPPDAPTSLYALEIVEFTESFRDEIEGAVGMWVVSDDPGLTSGTWEAADPNGTIFGVELAAPEDDNTPGAGVKAFVTQNGPPGGGAGADDIDNGATYLESPLLELAGKADAEISFAIWFYVSSAGTDFLRIEITDNDGASWSEIEVVNDTIGGASAQWDTRTIRVSDYVGLTDQVRLRFTAAGPGSGTVVEAGVDDFVVSVIGCDTCPADVAPVGAPDGQVDILDLLAALASWGPCAAPCATDTNNDLQVGIVDLLRILSDWGPCP